MSASSANRWPAQLRPGRDEFFPDCLVFQIVLLSPAGVRRDARACANACQWPWSAQPLANVIRVQRTRGQDQIRRLARNRAAQLRPARPDQRVDFPPTAPGLGCFAIPLTSCPASTRINKTCCARLQFVEFCQGALVTLHYGGGAADLIFCS